MPRLKRAAAIMALLAGLCLVSGKGTAATADETAPDNPVAPTKIGLTDLALRYEHGEGVPRDLEQARTLFCEAAEDGDTRAALNLAWIYLNGRGVARDDTIAVLWLRQAAAGGSAQAANLLRMLAGTAPATSGGCPVRSPPLAAAPPAPKEIRELVQRIAPRLGVKTELVLALIAVESAFDARAVSKRNAKGLMQLMPETAARFGVRDPFDPQENVRAGTAYLRWLLRRFGGNLTLALAAYNAGEGQVDAYGGLPPFAETIRYVARVKQLYAQGAGSP